MRLCNGALVMGLALSTQAALALDCHFVTECYETDACQETAFFLTVNEGVNSAEMVTTARNVPLSRHDNQSATVYLGGTAHATHLLSILPDGKARYTLHLQGGPFAVTYLGACSK